MDWPAHMKKLQRPSDMVAAYLKSFDNLKKEQSKFETAWESSMTAEQSEA